MSESDSDSAEKSHEPTQSRLEQARREGNVPRSADLDVGLGYLVMLLLLLGAGGTLGATLAGALGAMLERAPEISAQLLAPGGRAVMREALAAMGLSFAAILLAPMVGLFIGLSVQQALVFAPSKIALKLERVSPIKSIGQKFGPTGLFEFAKSALKLTIFCAVLALFLWGRRETLLALPTLPPQGAVLALGREGVLFLAVITAIALIIAAPDLLWQRFDHRRKLRMSRKELMDDFKASEGDPHLKQERRQRGQAIATNRMLADVPGADVVIVNPEHYAVALKWSRIPGSAPVCVAKGVDHVALRIRLEAQKSRVPVHSDPPTARDLHANVEIGQEVPPRSYRAVAAAIRFAERARRQARASGPGTAQ